MKKYHFEDYIQDILGGRIASGSYLRKAVERCAFDRARSETDPDFPYVFVEKEAQKVIDFVRFTRILEPLPFQQWLYAEIFGWRHRNNISRRRFQNAFISISKKNGKTLWASPLLLYDGLYTKDAESYNISTVAEVSKRPFVNLRNAIKTRRDFSRVLRITRQEITSERNNGTIKFYSSDKEKNGLGASLLIADEAAFFKDYVLFDRFRTGMKARRNRLVITITTNGEDKTLPYYEEYEKNKKVLDGVYEDEKSFIVFYEQDSQDEIADPETWIKSNPALDTGDIEIEDKITREALADDLLEAERIPSKKQRILLYNFNFWAEHEKTWIPSESWKPCRHRVEPDLLDGRRCCGGLDIAEVSDLTSFSLYFEPIEHRFPVLHRAYISEASLAKKELYEAVQYRRWIRDGWITVCEGKTIDHEKVCKDILELSSRYKILSVGIDPNYRAGEYISRLEEEGGLELVGMRQSIAHFSPFTKAWERDVLEGRVADASPVMAYCLSNVEVKPDPNNNYKPLKRNGQYKNKIDMVITSIMAHARLAVALAAPPPKENLSVLDLLDT